MEIDLPTITPTDDPEWSWVSPEVTNWFSPPYRQLKLILNLEHSSVPLDEPTRLWDRLPRREGALPLQVVGAFVDPYLTQYSDRYLLTTHPQPEWSHVYLLWVWKPQHGGFWSCLGKIKALDEDRKPRCLYLPSYRAHREHLKKVTRGKMIAETYAEGEDFVVDDRQCSRRVSPGALWCSRCFNFGVLWHSATP